MKGFLELRFLDFGGECGIGGSDIGQARNVYGSMGLLVAESGTS